MTPELSIVIPVLNESPNIKDLYDELTTTLVRERAVVRDHRHRRRQHRRHVRRSSQSLQSRDPHLRVIRFRRNFGQTAAFAAGFAFARGRLVVTADGDRQNDPADIPRMAAEIDDGLSTSCAAGARTGRTRSSRRRIPSVLANKLISWATGVELHDYGCSLKVFRAEVVKPLRLYGEMHRFLPAIASQMGVRIEEVVVNHRPRTRGHVEIWPVAHDSRRPRSADGEVPAQLLDAGRCRSSACWGSSPAPLGVVITGYLGYVRLIARRGSPIGRSCCSA